MRSNLNYLNRMSQISKEHITALYNMLAHICSMRDVSVLQLFAKQETEGSKLLPLYNSNGLRKRNLKKVK